MKLDFVILSKKVFFIKFNKKKKDCAIICLFQKYFKCFVIKNKNFNEKKNILNFYSLSLSFVVAFGALYHKKRIKTKYLFNIIITCCCFDIVLI